jgi:hypothetical protein
MTITDQATKKRYQVPDADVLSPMSRPPHPGWQMRCELLIFLVRSESRVFVGGGEHGFDGLVREADDVEIEALAERFDLQQLREILAKRANSDEVVTTKRSLWQRLLRRG